MDIEALRLVWVGHRVFLPSLGVYALVFDITGRGEVGIRFSSNQPDCLWEVWAEVRALGGEIVLV